MPANRSLSRRDLLHHSAAFGAFAVLGASACSKDEPKPLVCTDTTELSPTDLTIRSSLAYVDTSTTPGKVCSGCQQFIATMPGACGTCKVVKGPINPGGNCKSFVPKPV